MPDLVIRALLVSDIEAVCAIDRQCMVPAWSPETFASECRTSIAYYRVAERGGELLGYIGSHLIFDEGHITTFGVRPDVRRQGVGERLLADVIRAALERDCRRLTLEVRESNQAARALYAKYGFSPVSRRPRYYVESNEDAIVMWIEDMTGPGFQALLRDRLAAPRAAGAEQK